MNTEQARSQFTTANKHLRQQRREFVERHRIALMQSRNNVLLDALAKEMHASGLLADPRCPNIKDTRFRIIRTIYKIERETWGRNKTGNWYEWMGQNGLNWSFQFVGKAVKSA